MALKALMLRKALDDKRKELKTLYEKDADFQRRESELEKAILETETEEEKTTVSLEIEKYDQEKSNHEIAKNDLEREIGEIEDDLAKIEKQQEVPNRKLDERKDEKYMDTRKTKFYGMTYAERDAFFARGEVKEFVSRARSIYAEKRDVGGSDLLIPDVVLDLIRENIDQYSKLYKHVNVQRVTGRARQTVQGTIPEAVWTEMCASLNELSIGFTGVEMDGYKVGGYIPVCNALLEDSDIALGTVIIENIGAAIGYALDKAILFGTGVKMPLGIYTRLAETNDPNRSNTTIPWIDLHTSNIISISATSEMGKFQQILLASGAAKGKYSRGTKFWAMNDTTYGKLQSWALSINASGTIVSGMNRTFPVVGGTIELIEFVPDDVIIGGYGDLYLLAERSEVTFGRSEHALFLADRTVFKGTGRYDGTPVIGNAFVVMNLGSGTINAPAFAGDTANDASLASLTIGSISLSPSFDGDTYNYTGTTTTASNAINAEPAQDGATVSILNGSTKVNNGGNVTLSAGENVIKITVNKGNATKIYTITITKS